MGRRTTAFGATLLALVCAAGDADALDGRSVGLGNTGAAYAADGAATYFNPALLAQTDVLAATLAIAPLSATLETPIAGPGTRFASSSTPFPLFLAGANARLSERLVVGLSVYPVAGFGATYPAVIDGQDVTLTAVAIEASPAASFALTPTLAIGAAYRVTYTALRTGAPLLSTYETQTVSGVNALGAQLGIFYRPIPPLRIGLSYRSKIATDLRGTTTFGGMSLPTTSSLAWPHSFRLGAAVSAPGDRLLFAADASYSMFSDATQALVVTERYPAGPRSTTQPLDWVDSYALGFGVEWRVVPRVPLRLGYGLTKSRTRDDAASYFFVPPGFASSFHAGAGLRAGAWDLDVGGYYESAAKDVPNDAIANPGRYAVHGYAASFSATFHIEPEEER
jgi:long-subunit fatty acid transport protein